MYQLHRHHRHRLHLSAQQILHYNPGHRSTLPPLHSSNQSSSSWTTSRTSSPWSNVHYRTRISITSSSFKPLHGVSGGWRPTSCESAFSMHRILTQTLIIICTTTFFLPSNQTPSTPFLLQTCSTCRSIRPHPSGHLRQSTIILS